MHHAVMTEGHRADRPDRGLPPFAMLRAFEALARLGGIRKAARALGLHHSVISRHVTQLEAWLSVSLLNRSGNRFTLTEQGERYHARISAAMAEMIDATHELLDEEARRPLRIRCSHGLSIEWLASHILDFERDNPAIRLEIRPSDNPADLHRHEADANIFMHLEDDLERVEDGLKSEILARPLSMIAASPELARTLHIAAAADLLTAPLLHGAHTDDWRWWFTTNGVEAPETLGGELCWHSHMALEAARLGRGVALGNRFFFERDLERGTLVELVVPGTNNRAFGGYKFVAREDRWSTPSLAALRHFLKQRMKIMEG